MNTNTKIPWLSIIGIGEDGLQGISQCARMLIDQAEVLIGGERHLQMLPNDQRERLSWPSPLSLMLDTIVQRRGQRVCVLATGDPMNCGIGVTLMKRIALEEMIIIPTPSAFSLACARLGWDRTEVETLSLHGRPLELLNAYLQPHAKILLLSYDRNTPHAVAQLLKQRGYGASRLTVLEHMGGERERILSADIDTDDWPDTELADFNTLAIECRATADALLLARVPGLPDNAFQHDGQLTKQEIRATTLARLVPIAGQLLWDVGAGAGSIAIEWMRVAQRCSAIAIERDPVRLKSIIANANALGVPGLQVLQGDAPEALAKLESPDAIFIGGGITAPGMLETCWSALKPGGRLVANTVTIEGEAKLLEWRERLGGDLTRLAISRASPIGDYYGWRPLMPVTQFAAVKP